MSETSPDQTEITVLIVDDHDMVASGFEALLSEQAEITVVGRARTMAEGVQAATEHRPSVVLMDYRLPDGTGAEGARQIRGMDQPPAVVMVTSSVDRRVLGQALDAGCCGFVSKNSDLEDLVEAVRSAAAGDSYFTRDVLKHLVHLRRFDQVEQTELSDREVDVLQRMADGKSADTIAEDLFLSAHTVKNHLRHAMAKLEAHTKLEAVVKAIRLRLIAVDD